MILIEHWLAAHDIVRGNLGYLHAWLLLRYEDLARDPQTFTRVLAAFLDIDPADVKPPGPDDEPLRDGNAEYPEARPMTPVQAERAASWGYGVGRTVGTTRMKWCRHPLRHVREAVAALAPF